MTAWIRSKSVKYWTATALFMAGASGTSGCGTSSSGTDRLEKARKWLDEAEEAERELREKSR